jgi:hypothetical protein
LTQHQQLLQALKEEMFALETERLQNRISEPEYLEHKSALDRVLRRALGRASASAPGNVPPLYAPDAQSDSQQESQHDSQHDSQGVA